MHTLLGVYYVQNLLTRKEVFPDTHDGGVRKLALLLKSLASLEFQSGWILIWKFFFFTSPPPSFPVLIGIVVTSETSRKIVT